MSGPYRLPSSAPSRFGSEVDRAEPVGFRFGGRALSGLYGDTLASALAASGVAVLGSSPLLGRPRGLMGLGLEDHMPLALEGDHGPWSMVSGDEIVVREGLRARAQGLGQTLRRLAAPAAADRRALPVVQQMIERLRRALPLPAPRLPAGEAFADARRETCDVLIVGAGLAGLSAAAALRSAGLDVRMVEASHRPGGIADLYDGRIDGRPLAEWAATRASALRDRGVLRLSATAIAIDHDGSVTVIERPEPQRPGRVSLRLISAGAVVVATGFRERPLVFADNDRPGVTLATTARALLRRHAVAPGRKALVATSSDEGYRTAMDLRDAGVSVQMALDARDDPQGSVFDIAKALGAPISLSTLVTGVEYEERKGGLTGVRAQNRFGEGASAGARVLSADVLIVSGGFAPRDELLRGTGLDAEHGVHAALRGPNAIEAVAGGWAAGAAAAAQLGAPLSGAEPEVEVMPDEPGEIVPPSPESFRGPGADGAFVDFAADVTLGDLLRAVERRGPAPAAISRRLGLTLGPDAGRLSADLAAIAFRALGGPGDVAGPAAGRPTLNLLAARAKVRD
ncbi:FAD-dependent oxidoreductase [Hansschlegelia zhihuaiae]|uniref:FAD-binding protein n=1 Tax=Hansschlegelia zhihuaiae TaxID=405005 RepID=A0A4Q0MQN1_9HYPH|nr:FAD-dependent oxidoreductase [Hansschlegelia zhihuaiae]RXF75436.1 FAD-binding protein [Hansschlegelia zhihuaiae]